MLKGRFYIEILCYAREYYQASHKLFISKELFDRVQKQVEKIERPRIKGHDFAFSGLTKCGELRNNRGNYQNSDKRFELARTSF